MREPTVTAAPSNPLDATTGPVRRRSSLRVRAGRAGQRVLIYATLVAGGFAYIVPFLWMLRTSFMRTDKLFIDPPQLWPDPIVWENYVDMWETGPFGNWLLNSFYLVMLGMVGLTLVSIVVAFGFSRLYFPGRDQLFILVLVTMMLPGHVTIIPKFVMFKELSLLDTIWPIAIPNMFGSPFFIFILRQFFLTLPVELDESARVDGANRVQVLFRVIVPLSKPAIATVVVFNFINIWNDFFEPFVFITTPDRLPLAVGLRWFRSQYGTLFQMLMAASMVSVVPIVIVFFFAQKHFVRGIALTGIKA